MNDEIKEIKISKSNHSVVIIKNGVTVKEQFAIDDEILDYITNLQTIEKLYDNKLSENKLLKQELTNLQQENERLKKPDYYEKGLIGSIKERDKIIQDYKSRCKKAYKIVESYELGKYDYSIPPYGIIELKDCLKGCKDNE